MTAPASHHPHQAGRRCVATILSCLALLAGLWSIELPATAWIDPSGEVSSGLVGLLAAGLRVTASALLLYLTLAAALNLALVVALSTRPGGDARLGAVRRVTRWTPRWLAAATVSAIVGSGALAPGMAAATDGPAGSSASDHRDVVLELVEPEPSDGAAPRTMLPWADTERRLPQPPRIDVVDPELRADAPLASATRPAPPLATVANEHVVQPGDHFWSIAEQVVAERGLDTSVATYWNALVEANRQILIDPDNPDLLHPGQVLRLP